MLACAIYQVIVYRHYHPCTRCIEMHVEIVLKDETPKIHSFASTRNGKQRLLDGANVEFFSNYLLMH